jgi:hypothetical protein
MSSTSQALKRLGVGTVTVATVLAMPYVGVASAFAAAPGVAPAPTDVTITSQVTGNSSPRNDGTDTTVKVSANVAYAPAVSPASNAAAPGSVKFTYRPAGGTTDVLIGTDATAPYSVAWTPPAGGGTGYTLFAEALTSTGASYATPAKSVARTTSVTDASSVHITAPVEGGTEGYYASTLPAGNVISVSGTRSSDLPTIDLYTQVRDNSTGVLNPTAITLGTPQGTVAVGTPAAGASQAFSGSATFTTAIPADADVVVTAVATGSGTNGTSDEVTEAKLVKQVLTNVTVTPTTATKPVGATQAYVVKAVDQNAAAIAGLKVTASNSASGPSTIAPASAFTDAAGNATFTATAAGAPGTTTFTFQTQLNGASYVSTTDFSRTATLTSYTSTPTSATLTAAPSKALYAGQTEYTGTFPKVTLCVIDQNGNGTPAGTGGTPIVTDTRTDSNTTALLPATAVTVTTTAVAGTNCYTVNYPAATGTFGSDVIKAYFENNGTPGFQTGSTDVAAPDLTTKYANLTITALDTQSQKGTPTTVSFKVLGVDKTPFAGRQITLSTPTTATTGFTATQPAGTTAPTVASPSAVIATTDANGVASATVNSQPTTPATPGDVTVTVTAKDDVATSVAPSQVPTNVSAASTVTFRDASTALATLAQQTYTIIRPGDSTATPTSGTTTAVSGVRPGDVVQYSYQLQDANTGATKVLKNTSVALSLDHGFFTPDCTGTAATGTDAYSKCTFTPAPADGAKVGALKSLGSTLTLVSDASGNVTFSVAIARDVAFDQAGAVAATLTGVANGGTKASTTKTGFTTAGVTPINGGAVKIVSAGVTPSNNNSISGDVVGTTGTSFLVQLTDQYGNLVTLPVATVAVTVAGGGTLDKATTAGSFLTVPDPIKLTSSTTSFSGQSNTVTATWNAPVTTFKATTTLTTPATTTYAVATPTTTPLTDSFTVNLYAIDKANLTYTFASTPSNAVLVNTAVTTSVTVKDQKGNPVQGLPVSFIRSGPDTQSGNGGQSTNTAGKAGYSFSSTTPGTATVTVIVSDGSGNELSRGVQNVKFSNAGSTGTLSITADRGTIIAGEMSNITVTGTPGASYDVFAANRPSSTFVVAHRGILGANGKSTFEVHPLNNVNLIAHSGTATSSQIIIAVHTGLNIGAKRKTGGNIHTYVFYGQIYPNNRSQAIFIKSGSTTLGQATRDASGKNWTFTYDGSAKAGQRVVFYSYTASDTQNANGHSQFYALTL